MTKKEFKELWPTIKDKAVKIKYGKQTFHRLVLVRYVEGLGIVNTSEKGELSTVAIRSVELIEEPVASPSNIPNVEPTLFEPFIAEEVIVEKNIGDLLKDGYFLFVGKLGGNWKHVELIDRKGDNSITSVPTWTHRELFNTVLEAKRSGRPTPMVIVDDTGVAKEYYRISKSNGDWFFNKIE